MACVVCAGAALGCTIGKQLVADDGDFVDYRAFRVEKRPGRRLHAALEYLARHPRGAYAAEVQGAFDRDEPTFFVHAQASRRGIEGYLADLPNGPHAPQAMSLLVAYDTHVDDVETARLLRDARRTEATLEASSQQRRAVGETIAAALAALTDASVYDARIEDAPAPLRRVLGGLAPATWGGPTRVRERDLFFAIPTTRARESRVVTLRIEARTDAEDRVREGEVSGADLFVAWASADAMRALDPTDPEDRAFAATHAQEAIAGAVEAVTPAATCRKGGAGIELLVRRCDGWTITAIMGLAAGDVDRIDVTYEAAAHGENAVSTTRR